jgi:CubicO group peptidase (beta-lactamase class C family)
VAVVSGDGRLVYIRGFTTLGAYHSARETPFFAGPDSKFRLGSVSKLLTGLATLKLIDMGLLSDGTDKLRGRLRRLGDYSAAN